MAPDLVEYPPGCPPVAANLSNSELVKRLKILFHALKAVTDVECCVERTGSGRTAVDPARYQKLFDHLTQPQFLNNSNREVSIWLACCIANLFGIFMPNSPVGIPELLKEILIFLVRQIRWLSDVVSPLYYRYYYLLESLCIFGILELASQLGDDAQIVLRELIRTSFGVAVENSDDTEKRIQGIVVSQCTQILQSLDQISNSVLDAIFFYLIPPQKLQNRESYRMARDLLLKNQAAVEPYVQMLLNNAILNSEMPECELVSKENVFQIIFELHEFAPEMVYPSLHNLLPNLTVENLNIRKCTTELFGKVLGSQRSKLAEDMPEVWTGYSGRFMDISEEVRGICVKYSPYILMYHTELSGQLTELLVGRFHDVDEKVRLEAVRMVLKIAMNKFGALNERLLECLTERIRDKKTSVRYEAIRVGARIHRAVYTRDEFSASERASVLVILRSVLNLYYQPRVKDRTIIERQFITNFISRELEPKKRMQILFEVYIALDESVIRSFDEILTKNARMKRWLQEALELLAEDATKNKAKIDKYSRWLSESESDSSNFAASFRELLNKIASDEEAHRLVSRLFLQNYNCEEMYRNCLKVTKTLRTRFKLSDEFTEEVDSLLGRCAPLQIEATCITELLNMTFLKVDCALLFDDKNAQHLLPRAFRLLELLAKNYPHCFETEIALRSLWKLLEKHDVAGKTGVASAEEACLKILFLVAPKTSSSTSKQWDDVHHQISEKCRMIAVQGPPYSAKLAVRCITKMLCAETAEKMLQEIAKEMIVHISAADPMCSTALKTLGCCVTAYPQLFREQLENVIESKVFDIILGDISEWGVSESSPLINADVHYMERYNHGVTNECLLRIFGLRFVCTYLCAFGSHKCGGTLSQAVVSRAFEMYATILRGDLSASFSVELSAHLRVTAGCCLLKLASVGGFWKNVTTELFCLLSSLATDEFSFVRLRFVNKLAHHLNSMRLSVEYMGIFALAPLVHDERSVPDYRGEVRALAESCVSQRQKWFATLSGEKATSLAPYQRSEYCLPYAVYLLGKRAELTSNTDIVALAAFRECLWFLLDIFWSRKQRPSVEFILAIFHEMKGMRYAELANADENLREEENKKLWALADLGIMLLSYRIKVPLVAAAVRPILSKRFFVSKLNRQNSAKIYIPKELIEEEKNKRMPHQKTAYDSAANATSKLIVPGTAAVTRSEISEGGNRSASQIRRGHHGNAAAELASRKKNYATSLVANRETDDEAENVSAKSTISDAGSAELSDVCSPGKKQAEKSNVVTSPNYGSTRSNGLAVSFKGRARGSRNLLRKRNPPADEPPTTTDDYAKKVPKKSETAVKAVTSPNADSGSSSRRLSSNTEGSPALKKRSGSSFSPALKRRSSKRTSSTFESVSQPPVAVETPVNFPGRGRGKKLAKVVAAIKSQRKGRGKPAVSNDAHNHKLTGKNVRREVDHCVLPSNSDSTSLNEVPEKNVSKPVKRKVHKTASPSKKNSKRSVSPRSVSRNGCSPSQQLLQNTSSSTRKRSVKRSSKEDDAIPKLVQRAVPQRAQKHSRGRRKKVHSPTNKPQGSNVLASPSGSGTARRRSLRLEKPVETGLLAESNERCASTRTSRKRLEQVISPVRHGRTATTTAKQNVTSAPITRRRRRNSGSKVEQQTDDAVGVQVKRRRMAVEAQEKKGGPEKRNRNVQTDRKLESSASQSETTRKKEKSGRLCKNGGRPGHGR